MEKNKKIFFQEFQKLFEKNEVTSSLEYEISEIEENFGEYCLILRCDNFKIKGIFSKIEEKLEKNRMIFCKFYLDKSHEQIKIYTKYILKEKNNENKKAKKIINDIYNFKPEFLRDTLNSLKFFKGYLCEGNVFIYLGLSKKIIGKIKLLDLIEYEYYYIDYKYLENISKLNKNEFLYFKYHIINKNNITCNNLTFFQKATETQIFRILDENISSENLNDFQEVNEIKSNKSITLAYLFAKVILKSYEDKYYLFVDKFNRLIKLEYEKSEEFGLEFDLFDLVIIINLNIIKDEDNKFYYLLILSEESIIFKSNHLIFNKNISINNYTLLNIKIPDFKANNNYYDKIIISNKEVQISNRQHIYIFKFNNVLFNEIIPFIIKLEHNSEIISFKFFIVNNLMNNINIFLNYLHKDKCSIEYCYYNFFNKVPFVHEIMINEKKYYIDHYNSFDSINITGFILINIPSDENTNKIKNITRKEIISSQVWLTASKNNNNIITYDVTQILDIDESKPKTYLEYNLKLKKYFEFNDFYYEMFFFHKQWTLRKKEAYDYFKELLKKYESIDKSEFISIKSEYNISFIPESADFYTYKIYVNLILFDSLNNIKMDESVNIKNIFQAWNTFLKAYFQLVEKLNNLGKSLTNHQKMRIIHSYVSNIFHYDYPYNYSSKFLYINETELDPNNSYLLAYKFNIDIINNLKEGSALTKGFKQLDSYILKNYLIDDEKMRNEKNFSLLNEPIALMKYHLLINYENFIIIENINISGNTKVRVHQDHSNRITFINEKYLFNCDSITLEGEDNAFPISIECFHENSHEKKNSKNKEEKTPLTSFKDDSIIIINKREDGKYIESIIGNEEFLNELKKPKNKLGKLMKVKYFIKENFNKLHSKFEEIIKLNKENDSKISTNKNIIESSLQYDSYIEKEDKKSENNYKELKTVEDFERHYLVNNEFIYPDSVPYHEYKLGQKFEISQAEKDYLKKYENCMKFMDTETFGFEVKISY